MSEEKMIKVRLADGENGWAVWLGDGTVEVRNNAVMADYRVGDIVKAEVGRDGRIKLVGEPIKRKYPTRVVVDYGFENQLDLLPTLQLIAKFVEEGGGACEAMVAGKFSAALPEGYDVEALRAFPGVNNVEVIE